MTPLVERLGWVLVHSLWQFTLVALLAGAIVRAMRRNSSSARYGVHVVAMGVIVVVPLVTWSLSRDDLASRRALAPGPDAIHSTSPGADPLRRTRLASITAFENPTPVDATSTRRAGGISPPVMETSLDHETTGGLTPPARQEQALSSRIKVALQPWLTWIVGVWCLGVAVCSLRPLLGWHMLWRLKRVGVSPASDDVLAALRRVSERLQLRRAVSVLQSTLAQVPVVVGYLRPVVLLPVSLMTSLPAEQLEAILAHELAHVRRHDFVVNLLQTLVETFFFYHPAVWWLSHQIRVEREHCCDDLVVASFGNRVEYGRALLAIEEMRGRSSVLALGANDGSLLSRIRRIVGLGSEPDANERWSGASVSLMLALCALSLTWCFAMRPGSPMAEEKSNPLLLKASDGVEVELLGVSTHWAQADASKEPKPERRGWWRPDGAAMSKPPVSGMTLGVPPEEQAKYFDDWPAIAVRIRSRQEIEVFNPVIIIDGMREYVAAASGGSNEKQFIREEVLSGGPLPGLKSGIVRVAVGSGEYGPWRITRPNGTIETDGSIPAELQSAYEQIVPVELREVEGQTRLIYRPQPINYSTTRARGEGELLDVDGNPIPPGTNGVVNGDHGTTYPIPLARVSHYRFRLRAFRNWFTFENVSFQPGYNTEVKSSVGKTPELRRDPLMATLPNGERVEFVGLAPMEKEPKTWWKPDGSLLNDVPKYGSESFRVTGQDVRRAIIRVHGETVGHQDVTAPGMSSVLLAEPPRSGGPFIRISGGYAFPPGQKTGHFEVGVATQQQSPARYLNAKGQRVTFVRRANEARRSGALVVDGVDRGQLLDSNSPPKLSLPTRGQPGALLVDAAGGSAPATVEIGELKTVTDHIAEDIEVLSVATPPMRKPASVNGRPVMSAEKEVDNKVLSQQTHITWRAPNVPKPMNLELILIDVHGKQHRHIETGVKISEAHWAGDTHWGKAEQHHRFDVPLSRVVGFEYRVRPYQHWITFDNVALNPGEMTDVKVKVESAPEPRAGRGSPDSALDPTAGLPKSDGDAKTANNANGDLRSNPAAGSGDPRRAQGENTRSALEPIEGQVIDSVTGKPIDGATVRFRFGTLREGLGNKERLAELVFRNVGRFTFELPEVAKGRTDLFVERIAEHPDYQTSAPGAVPLHLLFNKEPNHAHDFIRKVALVPGKIVSGQVLDINGRPAKGISIFSGRNPHGWQNGSAHKTTTDANGRYRLTVPDGDRGRIYVIPNHAAAVSRAITVEFGEQPVFRLQRGTRLFGRVTDANGRGLANVVVRADGSNRVPMRTAMTDADGKYSLPPCQYGQYVVQLVDEGRYPELPKDGVRLPDVYLHQVVDLPKTAPTEQQLDFKPTESVRMTARYTTSDDQPIGGRSLSVSGAAQKANWWGRLREVTDQPGLQELRVPRSFEGRIDQNADVGGFLRILQEGPDSKSTSPWSTAKFDKDGVAFHIRSLKAGSITLRATHDGQPVKIAGSLSTPQFADQKAADKAGARVPSGQFRNHVLGQLWFDAHPNIDLLLKLEVPGFKPWQTTLQVAEGENRVIDVALVSDKASAGRGSPDPALDPTAGLPKSDGETKTANSANGDLRSNPAAVSAIQGEVLSVDQQRQVAEISLGEKDAVKKLMKFEVRSKDPTNGKASDPVVKGTVEVIRVEQDTSEVRILKDDAANKIAKGDVVVPATEKLTSTLAPGSFAGPCQVMRIAADGGITYGAGHLICHMKLFDDERLQIAFHNENQIWTERTLPLVKGGDAQNPPVWSAEIEGHTYHVTAKPMFWPAGFVFRLEKRLNGKLVHGSQQFFATSIKIAKGTLADGSPNWVHLLKPPDLREWRVDQSGAGVIAGKYTGGKQIMQIASDGTVTYNDQPHVICHLEVLEDDRLKGTFLDKDGKPNEVTLPLKTNANQRRASWSAEIDGHTLRATAVPYSSDAYIFHLEKLLNGKLIEGTQEFYAIHQKLRKATPEELGNADAKRTDSFVIPGETIRWVKQLAAEELQQRGDLKSRRPKGLEDLSTPEAIERAFQQTLQVLTKDPTYGGGQARLEYLGDAVFDRLVKTAKSDDPNLARWCCDALSHRGAKAVAPLSEILKESPDQNVRSFAASALGQTFQPAGVPALIQALDDRPGVRLSAILALQFLRDQRAIEPLKKHLADKSYGHMVALALESIAEPQEFADWSQERLDLRQLCQNAHTLAGESFGPPEWDRLAAHVDSENPVIAGAAQLALVHLDVRSKVPAIDTAKPGYRCHVLVQLATPEAIDVLMASLSNREPFQREQTRIQLTQGAGRWAAPLLISLLDDDSLRVAARREKGSEGEEFEWPESHKAHNALHQYLYRFGLPGETRNLYSGETNNVREEIARLRLWWTKHALEFVAGKSVPNPKLTSVLYEDP